MNRGKDMRINKYLAECNLGSRREVEKLILAGKVKVNNSVCSDLATDIKEGEDVVTYNGEIVTPVKERIYLALNKPKGYIVTRSDEYNRKTVFDLLPDLGVNLFAVGRLDKDSEGLLLLTNDGEFADRIMHPRYKLPKVYKVEIRGKIRADHLKELQSGMLIDGEQTLTARVFVKKRGDETSVLRFTIHEGKNRQIRKMVETLGYKVLNLRRLQIDGIKLGNLPTGMFRNLSPGEVRTLMSSSRGTRKNTAGKSGSKREPNRYKTSYRRDRKREKANSPVERQRGERGKNRLK